MSASEDEDGGRETSVEVPPGIMVEREEENKRKTDHLADRVQKLEGQVRDMHQRMLEAMGFTETGTEEENESWRHDGAGGEWQRWKGAWWVKVGRQNLNSRQRRQISRGLQSNDAEKSVFESQAMDPMQFFGVMQQGLEQQRQHMARSSRRSSRCDSRCSIKSNRRIRRSRSKVPKRWE